MNKRFLRHDYCEECGSSDNLVVYYNDALGGETWSCMTPGCNNRKTDKELEKDTTTDVSALKFRSVGKKKKGGSKFSLPEGITYHAFKERGISATTVERYNVGGKEGVYYFPYYSPQNVLIGAKIRNTNIPKKERGHFTWSGDKTDVTLFGRHCTSHSKALIITEGEYDALAAYEMTRYSAVSLPFGASSAAKYVKKSLEWIEQFSEVYLCFDNDEEGVKAAQECMQLFRPGKAYNVLIPEAYGKDSNDVLIAGKTYQYKALLKSAKTALPPFFMAKSKLIDLLKHVATNKERHKGTDTGLRGLNALLGGGLKQQEITTVFSAPGRGKTTLVRTVLKHIIENEGQNVLLFSVEESLDKYLAKLLKAYGIDPFLPMPEMEQLEREILEPLAERLLVPNSNEFSLDTFKSVIESAIRVKDVKLVVLDNVTVATASAPIKQHDAVRKLFSVLNELSKDELCKECHYLVIAHERRTEEGGSKKYNPLNAPSMTVTFGGSATEQYSWTLLALEGSPNSEYRVLHCLKSRDGGALGHKSIFKFNADTQTFIDSSMEEYNGQNNKEQVEEMLNEGKEENDTTLF